MNKEKFFEFESVGFVVSGLSQIMILKISKDYGLQFEVNGDFCEFTKNLTKPVRMTLRESKDYLTLFSDCADQHFSVLGAVHMGSSLNPGIN